MSCSREATFCIRFTYCLKSIYPYYACFEGVGISCAKFRETKSFSFGLETTFRSYLGSFIGFRHILSMLRLFFNWRTGLFSFSKNRSCIGCPLKIDFTVDFSSSVVYFGSFKPMLFEVISDAITATSSAKHGLTDCLQPKT